MQLSMKQQDRSRWKNITLIQINPRFFVSSPFLNVIAIYFQSVYLFLFVIRSLWVLSCMFSSIHSFVIHQGTPRREFLARPIQRPPLAVVVVGSRNIRFAGADHCRPIVDGRAGWSCASDWPSCGDFGRFPFWMDGWMDGDAAGRRCSCFFLGSTLFCGCTNCRGSLRNALAISFVISIIVSSSVGRQSMKYYGTLYNSRTTMISYFVLSDFVIEEKKYKKWHNSFGIPTRLQTK